MPKVSTDAAEIRYGIGPPSYKPDVLRQRRRFCHRAFLETSKRFGRDAVWYPIGIAVYNMEWHIGDLATQLFCWGGMSHCYYKENQVHTAKSRRSSRCNQAVLCIQEGPRPQLTRA